jgi:hypothetical protein
MPDGEDAAMQGMQPGAGNAPVDRATPHAGRKELRSRYDAVLPVRESRDDGVHGTSGTLAITIGANVRLDRHAAIVATIASRKKTRTAPKAPAARAHLVDEAHAAAQIAPRSLVGPDGAPDPET